MNRCEHGERVTQFCMTQHCHHREAAGCDYCMKKYHFHLTNTTFISKSQLADLMQRYSPINDHTPKNRLMAELSIEYLKAVRSTLTQWVDQTVIAIQQKMTNPLLSQQGLLPLYAKVHRHQYRKITAKQMRSFYEYTKGMTKQRLVQQQQTLYFKEVEWVWEKIKTAQRIASNMHGLQMSKLDEGPAIPSDKLNQVYEVIMKEKQRHANYPTVGQLEDHSSPVPKKLEDITKGSVFMRHRKEAHTDKANNKTTEVKYEKIPEDRSSSVNSVSQPEEVKTERKTRLRRRRSSIDDTLADMKFGKGEFSKQNTDDKKKQLLENPFSAEGRTKTDPNPTSINTTPVKEKEEKDQPEPDQNYTEIPLKSERERRSSEGNPRDEESVFDSLASKGINVADLINHIIPPPPEPEKPSYSHEPITNKVVTIPVVHKLQMEEIQSPIFKNRKRTQQKESGFGIQLNNVPSSEESAKGEKKEEAQQTMPTSNDPVVEEKKEKTEEEEKIVLQSMEKNSLLLFSEALKSDTEKAIEMLRGALKYSPNNLSAAEYLSYLYLQSGRAKECLQVCESIMNLTAGTPSEYDVSLHIHNNRAAALNMLGRYSESIMAMEKCLRYRRKHYFYKNLADAYFSLGIAEKAILNYEKAIRLDPGYDQAYFNLAVVQYNQEEYTSAQLNITQALKIDPLSQEYLALQEEIKTRMQNLVR